eukprot:Gregarina_sp_Poly_1__3526@NODE_202_length_11519_cov_188_798463_g180_i0_p6_GENE_NODE_202_length_11519_cov_188_798463_g180_i0NODE_202_length_11519_cov_188_798463_g180_i0_p6_ORF_typecomplete_len262_score18_95_NODE_202_length_11519_cov_188_798463_g180_i051235908
MREQPTYIKGKKDGNSTPSRSTNMAHQIRHPNVTHLMPCMRKSVRGVAPSRPRARTTIFSAVQPSVPLLRIDTRIPQRPTEPQIPLSSFLPRRQRRILTDNTQVPGVDRWKSLEIVFQRILEEFDKPKRNLIIPHMSPTPQRIESETACEMASARSSAPSEAPAGEEYNEGSVVPNTQSHLPSTNSGYAHTRPLILSIKTAYDDTQSPMPPIDGGYEDTRSPMPSIDASYKDTQTPIPAVDTRFQEDNKQSDVCFDGSILV